MGFVRGGNLDLIAGLNGGFVSGRVVNYNGKLRRVTHKIGIGKDAYASLDVVNTPGGTIDDEIMTVPLSVVNSLPTVKE